MHVRINEAFSTFAMNFICKANVLDRRPRRRSLLYRLKLFLKLWTFKGLYKAPCATIQVILRLENSLNDHIQERRCPSVSFVVARNVKQGNFVNSATTQLKNSNLIHHVGNLCDQLGQLLALSDWVWPGVHPQFFITNESPTTPKRAPHIFMILCMVHQSSTIHDHKWINLMFQNHSLVRDAPNAAPHLPHHPLCPSASSKVCNQWEHQTPGI